MAIELAFSGADLFDGAVSFHGNPMQPVGGDAEQTGAELLICHGAEDPLAPLSDVGRSPRASTAAPSPGPFAVCSDAVHSFTEKDRRRARDPGVSGTTPGPRTGLGVTCGRTSMRSLERGNGGVTQVQPRCCAKSSLEVRRRLVLRLCDPLKELCVRSALKSTRIEVLLQAEAARADLVAELRSILARQELADAADSGLVLTIGAATAGDASSRSTLSVTVKPLPGDGGDGKVRPFDPNSRKDAVAIHPCPDATAGAARIRTAPARRRTIARACRACRHGTRPRCHARVRRRRTRRR